MPAEDGLPRELAAVEARLASVAPKPSRLDRDALLYRAGYAAARASASRGRWLSRLTTAAAVLVAIVATHCLSTMSKRAPTVQAQKSAQSAARKSPLAMKDEPAEPRPGLAPRPSPVYRFDIKNAPLLAARERALQMEFDEPPIELASDAVPEADVSGTIQQLREELLPRPDNRARLEKMFPWKWQHIGMHTGEST